LDGIVRIVCSKIFQSKKLLKDFFAESDKNKDGKIDFGEFSDALNKFEIGLSDGQLYDFMTSFDKDSDGNIDFDEFEQRFGAELTTFMGEEEWFIKAIHQISESFRSKKKPIKHYFDIFDSNKSGRINAKEFSSMIKKYVGTLKLSKPQKDYLFKYIDANNNETITFEEFSNTFTIRDVKADTWQYTVLLKIYDTIRKSKNQLLSLFRKFDLNGDGKIDKSEFKTSLKTVNSLLGTPINQEQIEVLYKTIDSDNNGSIDYAEFFDIFKVIGKTEDLQHD